jgi:hypothetical protein
MKKLLFTAACALLMSPTLAAFATPPDEWTSEEMSAGVKVEDVTRFVQSGKSINRPMGSYSPDCLLIEGTEPVWGPAGGFFSGDKGTAWGCRPAPAPTAKKVRRQKR